MEEHDRVGDDADNLLVQTLELAIIALGLLVIHSLGSPLLMPMLAGLFLFFPYVGAVKLVQHLRKCPRP